MKRFLLTWAIIGSSLYLAAFKNLVLEKNSIIKWGGCSYHKEYFKPEIPPQERHHLPRQFAD